MELLEFIPQTFIILVAVLMVIGYVLKQSGINNKYIPLALIILGGILGALLALQGTETLLMGILYGILCGGASIGVHQVPKQIMKG